MCMQETATVNQRLPEAKGLAVQPHSTQMPGFLTKVLGMQEVLRARHVTMAQISKLEEAWKVNPGTSVEDLDKPGEDDEPAHVALRYSLQPVDRCSCLQELGFASGRNDRCGQGYVNRELYLHQRCEAKTAGTGPCPQSFAGMCVDTLRDVVLF